VKKGHLFKKRVNYFCESHLQDKTYWLAAVE